MPPKSVDDEWVEYILDRDKWAARLQALSERADELEEAVKKEATKIPEKPLRNLIRL